MDKDTFYDIGGTAEDGCNFENVPNKSSPFTTIILGDNKMADPATMADVADIRREIALETAQIQLENMKGFDRVNADILRGTNELRGDVKDTRYDIGTRIHDAKDAVTDQGTAYYIASSNAANVAARDLASLNTLLGVSASATQAAIQTGIAANSAATALESAKLGAAIALGQALLGKDLMLDGQKTRDLINDHKYHDMNRVLVERNTELVEERHERNRHRDRADQFQSQGQWAAVQSQLQAFQSQLQTATQGTVNFGTMSGNAGRNSSTNNVA